MLKILPLLLFPAFIGAIVYWLTGRQAIAIISAGIVLGAMLFIGVTS